MKGKRKRMRKRKKEIIITVHLPAVRYPTSSHSSPFPSSLCTASLSAVRQRFRALMPTGRGSQGEAMDRRQKCDDRKREGEGWMQRVMMMMMMMQGTKEGGRGLDGMRNEIINGRGEGRRKQKKIISQEISLTK